MPHRCSTSGHPAAAGRSSAVRPVRPGRSPRRRTRPLVDLDGYAAVTGAKGQVASPAVRLADVTTPALVVDRAAFDRNVADDGRRPPGAPAPPPREGVQVDGARRPASPRPAIARSAAPPSARSRAWPPPVSATTSSSPTRCSTPAGSAPWSRRGPGSRWRSTPRRRSEAAARRRRAGGARRRRRGHAPLRLRPRGRRAHRRPGPRAAGLTVRGVMGYEGHLMRADGGREGGPGRSRRWRALLAARDGHRRRHRVRGRARAPTT